MEEPIIRTAELCYSYEAGRLALDHIGVSIGAGERIAVVGSNGAGKSTFFLCLNGVLTPDSGEICYRGTRITKKELGELRRRVGIVFQDADSQIIASSVMAEISFGPMNLKLPREEVVRRVEMAMDYMNIAAFRDRPPHYLSGGEKKRVSIADIIAMEPEVILFDEPMAALDPVNAAALEGVLERLSGEEKTLLISTHDMDFAYRWAQRVLVFHDGALVADGAPPEVFRDEALVRRASLKRPALLDICAALTAAGVLPADASPRSAEELRTLLERQSKQ